MRQGLLGKSPQARRRLLLVVALAAAVFRLLYVAEIHDHPYWRTPLVDAADYHTRAVQVMRGEGLGEAVFYKAPAYAYLVGQAYRLAGPHLEIVFALQMLGGIGVSVLVAALAWHWFGPLAALVAGLFCGTYAPLPYYENQLLVESAALAASMLAVYLLWGPHHTAGAAASGRMRASGRDLAAGLAAGLALQLRPLDTVFVLALIIALLVAKEAPAVRLRRVVCVVAPVLLVLTPTLRHNRLASGRIVPISVNGGINFYIGNNSDYDATVAIRPGLRWEELTARFDAMDDPVRWQQNFYDAAFAWMRQHPGDAAALYLKKLALFWNRAEIDRNQDSRAMRGDSWVLRVCGVPWSVIAVLGLVGLGMHRRRWRHPPLQWLVLLPMLGVVAFFVTSRYRLAVVPYLSVAAGALAAAAWERAERRDRRGLLHLGAGLALAGLAVVPPWYGAGKSDFGRPEFELAEVLARQGDRAGALGAFERAVARHPEDPDVRFRYGEQLERSGELDRALAEYERAAALAPWSYKPPLATGAALFGRGDLTGAWAAFEEALRRGDPHGRVLYDMALVRERQGEPEAALDLYRRSLQLQDEPRELRERWLGVARTLRRLGREGEAREAAAQAARLGSGQASAPEARTPEVPDSPAGPRLQTPTP